MVLGNYLTQILNLKYWKNHQEIKIINNSPKETHKNSPG